MPVLMGEVVEWGDKRRCLVEGVQDHDEVERKVDALEELPDEAKNWYSKATMTSVKLASEAKMSHGSETSGAAKKDVGAATWARQKRE